MRPVKHQDIHHQLVMGCNTLNCDPWAIIIYDGNYKKWKGQALRKDIKKAFNNMLDIEKCVLPSRQSWINDMPYMTMIKLDKLGLIPILSKKLNQLLQDRRNDILRKSHIRYE